MSGYGFTNAGTTYDDEDRLTGYQRTNGALSQSWNLTSVGDWNSVTTSGIGFQPVVQNRTHGPTHELLTAGGQTVNTDVKGNITLLPAVLASGLSPQASSLLWDFDNKLKSVDVGNNSSTDVEYKYDALGRRVARVGSSGSFVYVQSDQQTIADYGVGDAPSSPLYRYVHASYIDEPVVRKGAGTGGTIHYYHRNQQYSITAVTTSAGAIAERYAYSAYGEPTICDGTGSVLATQISSLGNRYTYTGREWDATVGLYHFRARWMSPKSGRFLTRDPVGYNGSPFGLYESLLSNPIRYADPTGFITSVGEAWMDGFLWGKLYSIKSWLTASSPDGCRLNPESIIGDTIAQGSSFTFPGVTAGVLDRTGPITFTRPAKKSCCCPNDQVECAMYYVHSTAVMGIGVEISAGGDTGGGTVTSTVELARHDHWIKVAVCADNSRYSEVASRWISGPPGDRIHHLANGQYNAAVFGEPWGVPVSTFETFRTDLGSCVILDGPHLVDRIVLP